MPPEVKVQVLHGAVPNMVQPVTINNLHRTALGWNPYLRASIEKRILGNIRSAASGQSRLL